VRRRRAAVGDKSNEQKNMTAETKQQLIEQFTKRIKSFLWRALAMLVAVVVQFALDNVTQFQLSPQWTVLIGLGLGELLKFLNTGLPA
jgi:hypothetical protein